MLGKFINHCEDSLTAAVLTHLLQLPAEIFWKILYNACPTNCLPKNPGEPVSIDFWPNWNPDKTKNNTYVEPDVFVRFTDWDLIIEAKRWDRPMQDPNQWKNEVIAYANEYGSEKVHVSMIALGGIWSTDDDKVIHDEIICPVHMCKWSDVLAECQRMQRELKNLKYPTSNTHAYKRTLSHLIDLFSWHGFQTGVWFAEVVSNSKLPRLSPSIASHHLALKRIKPQLIHT